MLHRCLWTQGQSKPSPLFLWYPTLPSLSSRTKHGAATVGAALASTPVGEHNADSVLKITRLKLVYKLYYITHLVSAIQNNIFKDLTLNVPTRFIQFLIIIVFAVEKSMQIPTRFFQYQFKFSTKNSILVQLKMEKFRKEPELRESNPRM
uniref:Uncharacterized protein n=1 Tax=Gopherus evgoodei TaxID=1825980 RepID=A0A8C4WSE0_9SAUR